MTTCNPILPLPQWLQNPYNCGLISLLTYVQQNIKPCTLQEVCEWPCLDCAQQQPEKKLIKF